MNTDEYRWIQMNTDEYRWIQWNIQAQLFHPFCIFLGFLQHVHLFRCWWGRLPAKVPGGNSMPLPDTRGVYILEAVCTQGYWLDPSFFREPTVMTMSVQQQRWWIKSATGNCLPNTRIWCLIGGFNMSLYVFYASILLCLGRVISNEFHFGRMKAPTRSLGPVEVGFSTDVKTMAGGY